MQKSHTPMQQLLNRVSTWCGVRVVHEGEVPKVLIGQHVVARFPSVETLQASLCGSIKKQIDRNPGELPAGVWPYGDNHTVLIDLTTAGGMEEAIRVLLNTYILAQDPAARDWWLCPHRLDEDPTCEKIAQVIAEHRSKMQAVKASGE